MTRFVRVVCAAGLCGGLLACGADDVGGELKNEEPGALPAPVDRAFELLTGRFDSSAQAARDGRYFEVQLTSCVVEAPTLGTRVLYVEQAMMSAADAPYRQRLYVVSERDGRVVSTVNELDAPEQVIGICDFSDADRARVIADRQVTPMSGCEVVLDAVNDTFVGGTVGDACLNDYNGAAFATTEVTLRPDGIVSWDRGYNAEGAQVWGATAGGYEFLRTAD